jgi:hypothetical protein
MQLLLALLIEHSVVPLPVQLPLPALAAGSPPVAAEAGVEEVAAVLVPSDVLIL